MNLYCDLFWTFSKIGVCTFGGGYAMLPILQREVVEKKGWATEEELTDYFAIGQCTPGIIAVNTATFVGHKYRGVSGGVVATLGLVFPSLIIITLIAAFLSSFADSPLVQHALGGINACVVALIAVSVLKLGKSTLEKRPRRVHFSGGSGPGGGGQPAASGPRLPRRRGAGLPLLPRHPGGAGRSNGLVALPAPPREGRR